VAGAQMPCNTPPDSQCNTSPGTCSNGTCSYGMKADNTACDLDGSMCTKDTCKSGKCSAGAQTTCSAGTCMVAGMCNKTTGLCPTPTTAPNGTTCTGGTCSGGSCVAPLPVGSTCANGSDCSSNNCGTCSGTPCTRKCCADSTQCSCPTQNSANIFKNGGLDGDLSGWLFSGGTASRAADDATNCPSSGSMKFQTSGVSQQVGFGQCIPIPSGRNYTWGMKWKTAGGTAGLSCDAYLIVLAAGTPCSLTTLGTSASFQYEGHFYSDMEASLPTNWTALVANSSNPGSFDPGTYGQGYTHFVLTCQVYGTVFIDMAYLSTSNTY
jgi:hypothetical protein